MKTDQILCSPIWTGAGSGEFHVYRHLRRKEYARQKEMEIESKHDTLNDQYHRKIEENKRLADERTAKKRNKRLKKKAKLKRKKTESKQPDDESGDKESDESDSESDQSSPGKPVETVNKEMETSRDDEAGAINLDATDAAERDEPDSEEINEAKTDRDV